eukprot:747899-Hanusia_phi.AAC.2
MSSSPPSVRTQWTPVIPALRLPPGWFQYPPPMKPPQGKLPAPGPLCTYPPHSLTIHRYI